MKSFLSVLFFVSSICLYGQPSGYTRGGAEATAKSMKLLFTESFLFSKGGLNVPGGKANSKSDVVEALTESDKVITEYEQKVDEFVKSKPVASVLKSQYHEMVSKVNGFIKCN